VGSYDHSAGAWMAEPNGLIIEVLANGIDITGTGQAATPAQLAVVGIDATEAQQIASLFAVGRQLWRAPVGHFSEWDCNWPYGPDDPGDGPPEEPPPPADDPGGDPPPDPPGAPMDGPPDSPAEGPPVGPDPPIQCGSVIGRAVRTSAKISLTRALSSAYSGRRRRAG
jgi:hypothetical protein